MNWCHEHDALLRDLYADHATSEIAAQLGRTVGSVYQRANALGLKKSEAYRAAQAAEAMARGHAHPAVLAQQFKKGLVPHNKGVKQPGWAPGRMAETQFRPSRPASEARNYQPIGSYRVAKDGILERKVTDDPAIVPARRWVAVHRLVWEAAHGAIPAGHAVVFRPGRKTVNADAITLDALEMVTRAELMRRNSYHNRYPEEVCRAIQLRGALNRQINRMTKEREA